MGVRNRERRAAKKRARRPSGAGGDRRPGSPLGGSGRFEGPFGAGDPFGVGGPFGRAEAPWSSVDAEELVRGQLLEAARSALDGDRDGEQLRSQAAALLGPEARLAPRETARLAAVLAERCVRAAWEVGWQPVDLAAVARRQLPKRYVNVVPALVAELTARSPAARVDPRWSAQLAGVAVEPDLAQRVARLAQWAEQPDGLAAALAVTGLAGRLPRLPSDVPLPGMATARPAPADGVDPRALGRIRALLAKAESTTFPDEAEALSGKAQELMSRLSIDRLVVEASAPGGGGPVPVSSRRIWLDAPYVMAKGHLADAVGRANRCRAVITEAFGFVTVFGDPADLASVELLVTSLLVQANRSMLAHGRQVDAYGRSRSRSFRQSFLVSYATRIGERLNRAAEDVVASHPGAAELVPVLRSAEQRVEDEVGRIYPQLSHRGVSVGGLERVVGRAGRRGHREVRYRRSAHQVGTFASSAGDNGSCSALRYVYAPVRRSVVGRRGCRAHP